MWLEDVPEFEDLIMWTWSYGNEVNIGIPEWRMVNGFIMWTGAMAMKLILVFQNGGW